MNNINAGACIIYNLCWSVPNNGINLHHRQHYLGYSEMEIHELSEQEVNYIKQRIQ